MADADFILVGAGHNTLGAACYLALCGQKVLVLEKNAHVGGGVISEEVTLPGFRHDSHASGVVHLQGHPIVTSDELGLMGRYGLKFAYPEASYMTIFSDGTSLTCYADLDRACADIAKFSTEDAQSYRALVGMMDGIMPMINMAMARPPIPFAGFMGMLGQMPGGNELIAMMLKSALDIVDERFTSEKVKIHLLKWVSEGLTCAFDQNSTGIAMLYLLGFSHSHPAGVPIGGMGALSDAMVRCIEDNGGAVRTGVQVEQVLNDGGKVRSVRTADGQVLSAAKGVVAGIHPHLLGDMVEGIDPALAAKARTVKLNDFGGIVINCALREAPQWTIGREPDSCLYINAFAEDSLIELRKYIDTLRLGQLPDRPIAVVSNHTNFDPSRAPEGQHTLYIFSWGPGAFADGGMDAWDAQKEARADAIIDWLRTMAPNLTADNILARHVTAPSDHVRHSPSFQRGDYTGGAMYLFQMMGMRPIPELAQYAVPGAQGLYLAGPAMHPGGGVTGGGRPVAIRIMEDLGIDYSKVIRN